MTCRSLLDMILYRIGHSHGKLRRPDRSIIKATTLLNILLAIGKAIKYRAEIDGLRAIAVIPVILFHAGFQLFSGGFVGVDVFFVISGYLITTIILTEKEQGIFSLVNFYERRARRILPALFLVMFVSLPFAWLWLLPADMKDFSKSLIYVSTFSSNILFWQDTGYWGIANELKPLLHTWSLAVEEQYYVIFPLYLMLMWSFRKRWILSSFLAIALISLVVAQWGAYHHPVATFFLLPTRAWELAIGASIAFYFLYRKQTIRSLLSHKSIDEILSLVGLLMIGYAVFAFDESVPFPGFYALIPTVGTGLIILFSSQQTIVGRLLGTKLLVGVGLISYSFYLWHQPLFAFARSRTLTEPSDLLYVALSVLSMILAYLSWRYIEKPFRKKGVLSRKSIFTFMAIGSAFFITIGFAGNYTEGFQNRSKMKQSILNDFSPHKLLNHCGKSYHNNGVDRMICIQGARTNSSYSKFAVFGDSHSTHMLPAFELAARSIDAKYVSLGLVGCPPLLGIDVAKGNHDIGVCENITKRQFEYVRDNKIDKVFLVGRWSLYTDGGYDTNMKDHFLVDKNSNVLTKRASRTVFVNALENTVEAYRDIGANVYILTQNPQQKTDPRKLYEHLSILHLTGEEKEKVIENYSISRNRSNDLQAYNRRIFDQLASEGKIKIVNLDDYYCSRDICQIGDRNHSTYYDKDHLSTFGAELVADEIIKHIE